MYSTDAELAHKWAGLAAQQGDRDGLLILARCFLNGFGCVQDEAKGRQLMTEAAKLGANEALSTCAIRFYSANDWQRYRLWSSAAARGDNTAAVLLADSAAEQLEKYEEAQNGSGRIVFEIGAAFSGHVHLTNTRLFDVR
jgi:TPR repeat protein